MNLHQSLHSKALLVSKEYLKCEAELISVLQSIDQHKSFSHFGMPSLFAYATKLLSLSESTAYALISVARKSQQIPELKTAIEEKKLTLSNARRIVPILTSQNKSEWIKKASELSQSKLEMELAKSFPENPKPTRIIPKSETHGRIEMDLPLKTLEKLKRVREILSQKKNKNIEATEALDAVFNEFIERHDPIEKAKRSKALKTKRPQNPTKPLKTLVARPVQKREPLLAFQKHEITLRDQGQCTHTYPDGTRCESKQWLHVHHIHEVSKGGTNTHENLTTLCSTHHRAKHLNKTTLPTLPIPAFSSTPPPILLCRTVL